jgi:hypothetical protein
MVTSNDVTITINEVTIFCPAMGPYTIFSLNTVSGHGLANIHWLMTSYGLGTPSLFKRLNTNGYVQLDDKFFFKRLSLLLKWTNSWSQRRKKRPLARCFFMRVLCWLRQYINSTKYSEGGGCIQCRGQCNICNSFHNYLPFNSMRNGWKM